MEYQALLEGRNLFIGAHPDDVVIGAFGVLSANAANSVVLDITNGVSAFTAAQQQRSIDELINERTGEEEIVMETLGVREVSIFDILSQESYRHMHWLIARIADLIKLRRPDRIFTHESPQAHPDHEVACFCVHQAVRETGYNIPILEFPLYAILDGQQRQNCSLSPGGIRITHAYTPSELEARKTALAMYRSQPDLLERYLTDGEQFRVCETPRHFNGSMARSDYIKPWVRVAPETIHDTIRQVLRERNG